MDFINKNQCVAIVLRQIAQHRFEAFFKFAAEFGTGNQRGQIQHQQAFVAQRFRHFAVNNALRQPFHNSGFTHAGLANQHGVVFGAPLQYLDGAADFVVAANHRIQFAVAGALGEVEGVFFECFALVFGIGVVYAGTAAHGINGGV